jgi:hypothetical protein
MSVNQGRWARNKKTADYLGVCAMTLWRWKHDSALGFPAPTVIRGIEYNNLDLIDEFMQRHVGRSTNERTAAARTARHAKNETRMIASPARASI